MGYNLKLREEELKLKVAKDFFKRFDSTKILGNIDFCISYENINIFETTSFLWAESKPGNKGNIYYSFIQLILTIGKEKHNQKHQPPPFLGAFNAEKIAFIKYSDIMQVFSQNDFNWNVTPSDYNSKEFKKLYSILKDILKEKRLLFDFEKDKAELKSFIKSNFILDNTNLNKIQITEDNFVYIYIRWINSVKPSIAIDWDEAKRQGILDTDFYLADILSEDNKTLKDKLHIVLLKDHYELLIGKNKIGLFDKSEVEFNDNQRVHTQFWNIYHRPPREEFWNKFINRRDLLVPEDIRERKGAFYTPERWVKKAQLYLEKALGRDYQDEYYIWDCAAGTGNLLAGLNNKYKLFASDFDRSNVDIIKELTKIQDSKIRLNLLEPHVFEFDFLNDDFSKCPTKLQNIIKNEPHKLIIFINPPYGESGDAKTQRGTGKHKDKIAKDTKMYNRYLTLIGSACGELYTQFFIRIYKEIPNCILASFSTPKYINSQNFIKFRKEFKAKFLKGFVVPAHTFDNVDSDFPIGFFVWDTSKHEKMKKISLSIYGTGLRGRKNYFAFDSKNDYITYWLQKFYDKNGDKLGILMADSPDFQQNSHVALQSKVGKAHIIYKQITLSNLIPFCIYFSVRQVIKINWLNNKDNFLCPNNEWEKDMEFQSDCLFFALFDEGQNKINANEYINHFIPFSANDVKARDTFESDFMFKFINGKYNVYQDELNKNSLIKMETINFIPNSKIIPSLEAKAVFNAGLKLWRYYHLNANDIKYNTNASLYNIKEYFQERQKDKNGNLGELNKISKDEHYNILMASLREKLDTLAKKIEPKVYEYGFLKK